MYVVIESGRITDAMSDVQAIDILTHIARMYDVDIILGGEED